MASSVRRLRVLALMNDDKVPPEDIESLPDSEFEYYKTDYDVCRAVRKLGHELEELGVRHELGPLRETLERFKPHVVFNLLEEFGERAIYDQNVISYLELMRTHYTGCNPRGLIIARD